MKLRQSWTLLMVVSLLFVATNSIFAQNMRSEPCFGLNDDDCSLYYEFQKAGLPESTAFSLVMDFNVTAEGESIAFNLGATGAYVLDTARVESAVEAFGGLGILDVSPRAVLDLANSVVSSFDAELFFDLNGIPGITDLTGGEPFPTIDLWLVDGVAYADLSLVSMFMGNPSLAGVYGLDVFEILTFVLENVTLADLMPRDMGMGDFGAMNPQDAFMQGFTQGFNQGFEMGAMMDEDELSGFINIARLEDSTVDGVSVAVYQTSLDFAAFFSIESVRTQMLDSMAQQGMPDDINAEDVLNAIVTAFENSTVTVTESYDLESLYLLNVEVATDVTLDPAAFAELDPDGFTGDEQPMNFQMNLTFTRSNINGVEAIILPEGAQAVPLSALMGEMGAQ